MPTLWCNKPNVSTVTNLDGYFSIRIPFASHNAQLIIRHLGYENHTIPMVSLIDRPNNNIRLTATNFELAEVVVMGGDGTELVRKALRRIPQNFSNEPNMMIAFYCESIRRGNNNFISLVEAVVDVHKAAYNSFASDQVRIISADALPIYRRTIRFCCVFKAALPMR